MSNRPHRLHGHPDVREIAVPVATVWTSPEAPRELDEPAVRDVPDMAAWTAAMDAETRLGLHGRTLTQLLLGEGVLVLEHRGEWSRVAAPMQASSADEEGYPGWVRTAHLATPVEETTGPSAFVMTPSAVCRTEDGATLELSCGTGVWAEEVDDTVNPSDADHVRVLLPEGRRGTVPRSAVRLSHKDERPAYSPDDLLATARQFLGLRYLWGGTSAWGLDCSGLVHLTYRAHGQLVPRDAFDQAAATMLEPVDPAAVRPGDLYFFARPDERIYHVGFATRPVETDGTRWMLHAPEGGGLIEDAPMAADRAERLVSAGRVRP